MTPFPFPERQEAPPDELLAEVQENALRRIERMPNVRRRGCVWVPHDELREMLCVLLWFLDERQRETKK